MHLPVSSVKKISDGKFSAVIWDMNKWQCTLLNSWVIIVNYNISLLINEHKINSFPSWSLFGLFQAVRQTAWCISQKMFSSSPITSIIQIAEPLLKIEGKKKFQNVCVKCLCHISKGNCKIIRSSPLQPSVPSIVCTLIGMVWWVGLGDTLATSHLAFSALGICPRVGFLRAICQVQMSLNSRQTLR